MKNLLHHRLRFFPPRPAAWALVLLLAGMTAAPAQVLMLKDDAIVAGSDVLLRELLMETKGIPEAWLDRAVLPAPPGNSPESVPITAIAYALQKYPDMKKASINGNFRLTIARAQRLIMPDELTKAVEDYVARENPDGGERRLEFASVKKNLWVPRGETEFRVSPSRTTAGIRQFETYIVEILVNGNSVCSVPVRAQQYVLEHVWVAARPLDSGQLLQPEDLRVELLPVEMKGERRIPSSEQIAGQEVDRSIRQGTPILRNHVRTPLCAKKGDFITVQAGQGALQISLRAKALGTGRLGDRILAENVRSKRQLLVQLTGIQKARVAKL